MATVPKRHIWDKSTSLKYVGRGLGMSSILPFPRCCLESSTTLNCMIFAAFSHLLCSLAKHWKSRRGGL